MPEPTPPPDVVALARVRSAARARRDWPEADRLRAELAAAGWKVVDRGAEFELLPAHPPDLVETGRIRYGRSSAVPSVLEEPTQAVATIVLLATDWPADLERALGSLREHAPTGTQIVIVADGPAPAQEAALLTGAPAISAPIGGTAPEIVWTSQRLGHAAATNAGLRRSGAPVIVLLDTSMEASGDFVTPLVGTLDSPSVAIVGAWGMVSDDLRHFTETAAAGDVDAVEGYCQAFRREDVLRRGPLDERFRFYRNLDIWWSLVLRDEGEGRTPRRALQLAGLPLVRHEQREYTSLPGAERDRLSRRNFYRIIDRFGSRRDLLVSAGEA